MIPSKNGECLVCYLDRGEGEWIPIVIPMQAPGGPISSPSNIILNPLEAPVKVRQSQDLERTWTDDSRAV